MSDDRAAELEAWTAANRRARAAIDDRECVVGGCTTKPRARRMCDRHYRQWRRTGSPEVDLSRRYWLTKKAAIVLAIAEQAERGREYRRGETS